MLFDTLEYVSTRSGGGQPTCFERAGRGEGHSICWCDLIARCHEIPHTGGLSNDLVCKSGYLWYITVTMAAQVSLAEHLLYAACAPLRSVSSESGIIHDPGNFHTPVKYTVWEPCLKHRTSNTYDLLSGTKCGSLRQLLYMVHCLQSSHGDKVLNRPIVLATWDVTLMDVPQWIFLDLIWRKPSATLSLYGWHCPFNGAAGWIWKT